MNQLTTCAITSHSNEYVPFIRHLYQTAFPENERRPFEQLPLESDTTHLQLLLFRDSGEVPVGFAIVWNFGDCCFIEHLAIAEEHRSKGYGGQIVQQLLSPDYPCLLEVEPPHDEISEKRVRFYKRMGFSTSQLPYQQPPYHKGLLPVPMILMCCPAVALEKTRALVNQIHREVYPSWG